MESGEGRARAAHGTPCDGGNDTRWCLLVGSTGQAFRSGTRKYIWILRGIGMHDDTLHAYVGSCVRVISASSYRYLCVYLEMVDGNGSGPRADRRKVEDHDLGRAWNLMCFSLVCYAQDAPGPFSACSSSERAPRQKKGSKRCLQKSNYLSPSLSFLHQMAYV